MGQHFSSLASPFNPVIKMGWAKILTVHLTCAIWAFGSPQAPSHKGCGGLGMAHIDISKSNLYHDLLFQYWIYVNLLENVQILIFTRNWLH